MPDSDTPIPTPIPDADESGVTLPGTPMPEAAQGAPSTSGATRGDGDSSKATAAAPDVPVNTARTALPPGRTAAIPVLPLQVTVAAMRPVGAPQQEKFTVVPQAAPPPAEIPESASQPEAKSKSRTAVIAAAAVAVLIIVGVAAMMLQRPGSRPATSGSDNTPAASATVSTPAAAPAPGRSTPPISSASVSSSLPAPDGGATSLEGPPKEVLTFGGHRYQWLPDLLLWTKARAKAESMGGHLATITSKEENDWIAENIVSRLPQGLGVWIGGTHDGAPVKWRWVTGEPFAYTNWAVGEPNMSGAEPALQFIYRDQGDKSWIDLKNTGMGFRDRRGGILVEWDDAGSTTAGAK